jgi:hypothetical protein
VKNERQLFFSRHPPLVTLSFSLSCNNPPFETLVRWSPSAALQLVNPSRAHIAPPTPPLTFPCPWCVLCLHTSPLVRTFSREGESGRNVSACRWFNIHILFAFQQAAKVEENSGIEFLMSQLKIHWSQGKLLSLIYFFGPISRPSNSNNNKLEVCMAQFNLLATN